MFKKNLGVLPERNVVPENERPIGRGKKKDQRGLFKKRTIEEMRGEKGKKETRKGKKEAKYFDKCGLLSKKLGYASGTGKGG